MELAMSVAPAFDATAWITEYMPGGTELLPATTLAVANFTMMWNLFEDVVCHNKATVHEFERLAQSLAQQAINTDDSVVIESCIAFWQFRYRNPDGLSKQFDGLRFRLKDRREIVEKVILGASASAQDKFLTAMVIVYRIRNNLFHGLKTIDMLNDQVQNLNNASRCLGSLLHISRTHLVLDRPNSIEHNSSTSRRHA